jgi:hypothetical protein
MTPTPAGADAAAFREHRLCRYLPVRHPHKTGWCGGEEFGTRAAGTHAPVVKRALASAERALGYSGAIGGELVLHEGIGPQCIEEFRGADVIARVFRKPDVDKVQQLDVFIAAVEFDGKTIQPDPALKLDQVDRAAQEAGELPTEIGDRAIQRRFSPVR